MNIEKLAHSKINRVADWILRIIVLNGLMILTMLPIITIFVALSSGYNMFSDYVNGKNPPLIKGYIKYFKTHFLKKLGRGLIFIILSFFLFSNIRFYLVGLESDQSLIDLIGYYVSIILLVMLLTVMLYSLVVTSVYPKLRLRLFYKMSFFLAGKYFFKTIMLALVTLIPFVMFLTPFTMMLFIFMGLSIPVMLNVLLTRNARHYMESLGENDD